MDKEKENAGKSKDEATQPGTLSKDIEELSEDELDGASGGTDANAYDILKEKKEPYRIFTRR